MLPEWIAVLYARKCGLDGDIYHVRKILGRCITDNPNRPHPGGSATPLWTADISHKEYLGKATLNANIAYKRGTGLYGAQAAPEQAFSEGTARMKVITADADFNLPFNIGKQ